MNADGPQDGETRTIWLIEQYHENDYAAEYNARLIPLVEDM